MTASTLREMVQAIRHNPEDTVRNWLAVGEQVVLDEMSGEFLRLVTEHHLDALAFDAIQRLDWEWRISPYIIAILKRRAALNQAVFDAHYDALVELHQAAPHLVEQSMIPKGAILGTLFPSLTHRRMTDYDLVLPAPALAELTAVLRGMGYEEEPGGFGHDLVKRIGPLWSWRDRITMHLFPMRESYVPHTEAGAIRDVPCRLPSPELHVISLLLNAQEHAASYTYGSFGSDLQFIRVVDIELLVDKQDIDPLEVWRVATELGVRGQVSLGLWVQREMRGALPPGWDVLAPAIDSVAEFGELVAMPGGQITQWGIPARDRVFHPNRTGLALRMLAPEQQTTQYLHDLRRAHFQEDEPAELIVERARAATLEVDLAVRV